MADNAPSLTAVGLSHFDLPTIFRCAVELAEAAATMNPANWSDLPIDIEGPSSPDFERWMERHARLRRIEEETQRLKQSLGATGPLEFLGGETDGDPKWETYDQRFKNTDHDRVVRLSLFKLATAAIDLSGFATWREWQWSMRETGCRLLAWGLSQLWEGMSETDRSKVRDRLSRTHKAIGWPTDPATDPLAYDGPEEIPLPDQCRIVANYVSCHRDYLNDVQKANNKRVQQAEEKYLRSATLADFVELAKRAEQVLQAIGKRDFDSTVEWGDSYTKVFWSLACLRRAHEIQPIKAWPAPALEQRKVLAEAANILLTAVGGTSDAKAALKPAEVDDALEGFQKALGELREESQALPMPDLFERLDCHPDSPRGELIKLITSRPALPDHGSAIDDAFALMRDVIVAARKYLDWLCLHSTDELKYACAVNYAWGAWDRVFQRTPPPPRPKSTELLDAHDAFDALNILLEAVNQLENTGGPANGPAVPARTRPQKRSTERGEGRAKLVAALTRHHKYADGSCLNLEPIGNNELAKAADVSVSTASTFFNDKFGGHTKYKVLCRDSGRLIVSLKILNDEFAPFDLYGRRPANEDDRDDEE